MECLREAAKLYEVIVFTASEQNYADAVLNHLDPAGDLIHHRLYRQHCIRTNGVYVKDLRILANRRLEHTVIVDNSALSFAFQVDNGIPIITWLDDVNDKELANLKNYLRMLSTVPDVRVMNQ
jgi:CTD small phosphatase-like protein 2